MEKLIVPDSTIKSEIRGSDVIDIKTGEICLVLEKDGEVLKHKLYMKVFKNSYEHHAQLYTDAECSSLKYAISMRNCLIKVDEPKMRIAIHDADGSIHDNKPVLFEVDSAEEVLDWITSLTPDPDLMKGSLFSPASPRRTKVNT